MTTREEPVYVGSFEPGSPEWHTARARGIGGSEIAAVLGLSPWESRFSLWHRKIGLATPVVENDVMYWGKAIEPVIRAEWNKRHADDGLAVREVGTWSHYRYPWMIANPDGAGDNIIWEGKTARDGDGWGEEGTDEIPVYYRCQALWYLDVFGLDVCHLSVLIGGSDYREYHVEYDADEAEFMRAKAREFLDEVEQRTRPSIDAHDTTYQTVRELNPDIADVTFDVPANIARPYLDAIDTYEAAKAEKQRTAAVLLDAMGNARRARWDGQQIAMRVPGRGTDSPPYLRHTPTKPTGQKVSAA